MELNISGLYSLLGEFQLHRPSKVITKSVVSFEEHFKMMWMRFRSRIFPIKNIYLLSLSSWYLCFLSLMIRFTGIWTSIFEPQLFYSSFFLTFFSAKPCSPSFNFLSLPITFTFGSVWCGSRSEKYQRIYRKKSSCCVLSFLHIFQGHSCAVLLKRLR